MHPAASTSAATHDGIFTLNSVGIIAIHTTFSGVIFNATQDASDPQAAAQELQHEL